MSRRIYRKAPLPSIAVHLQQNRCAPLPSIAIYLQQNRRCMFNFQVVPQLLSSNPTPKPSKILDLPRMCIVATATRIEIVF